MMEGKVCIVTGANAGIGKATALELAKKGAHVVMVCRSKERGKEALTDIRALSGSKSVDLLLADLSSQNAIYRFTQKFKSEYERLDVLVNNAGAIFSERQLSVDGLEMTFALNHMGYFLTTLLLLNMLKVSPNGRIVNVSSDAHRGQSLNFDDLQTKEAYSAMRVYGRSKLANLYFTYELARQLEGNNITVNALHPGAVATNFGNNLNGMLGIGLKLLRPLFIKSAKGAETSLFLATAPQLSKVSGSYFAKCQETKSSDISYSTKAAKQLWQVSEKLLRYPVTAA